MSGNLPYTNTFQAPPCNKDWYDALSTGQTPAIPEGYDFGSRVATIHILKPNSATGGVIGTRIITNVYCKPTEDFGSGVPISIDTLISVNATEEIDPTMLETKIPMADFSFKALGIDENTSLSDITAFLEELKNSYCDYENGFAYAVSPIELDGEPTHSFSDYHFDTEVMNYYKITDAQFNYQTSQIEVQCEHLLFGYMRDTFVFATNQARFPYHRNAYPEYFWTPEGQRLEVMFASMPVGFNLIPEILQYDTYSYTPPDPPPSITMSGQYNILTETNQKIFSLDTSCLGMYGGLMNKCIKMYNSSEDSIFQILKLEEQRNIDGNLTQYQRPAAELTKTPNIITPIATYTDNESIYDVMKIWCMQNKGWMLPYKKAGWFTTSDPSFATTPPDTGLWHIEVGDKPDENVFLDKSATYTVNDYSNGTYYKAIENTPYYVYPSMILSQTQEKIDLDLDEVKYIKTYRLNVQSLFSQVSPNDSNFEFFNMRNTGVHNYPEDLEEQIGNGVDEPLTYYTLKGIYSQYGPPEKNLHRTIFNSLDSQKIGDQHNWYDDWTILINDKNNEALGMASMISFGTYIDKYLATPLIGLNLSNPRGLYNTECNVYGYDADHQPIFSVVPVKDKFPFTFRIRKTPLDENYFDANDNIINIDDNPDEFIDSVHNFENYHGVWKIMLDRANGTDLTPQYGLRWTMIDDPSLRVGTVVRVPLRNQYVKVFITQQKRTFDGGSRLECEGWVMEETDEKVYDPSFAWLLATQRIEPTGPNKGEWVDFTWQLKPIWLTSPTMLLPYQVQYSPLDYGTVVDGWFMNEEEKKLTINLEPYRQALGDRFELGDNVFRLWTRYPYNIGNDGTAYWEGFPFVFDTFDNSQYSLMYSGQIVAGNAVVPLTHNHWMVG